MARIKSHLFTSSKPFLSKSGLITCTHSWSRIQLYMHTSCIVQKIHVVQKPKWNSDAQLHTCGVCISQRVFLSSVLTTKDSALAWISKTRVNILVFFFRMWSNTNYYLKWKSVITLAQVVITFFSSTHALET